MRGYRPVLFAGDKLGTAFNEHEAFNPSAIKTAVRGKKNGTLVNDYMTKANQL